MGRNIHNLLDGRLKQIQDTMEKEVAGVCSDDEMKDTRYFLAKEKKKGLDTLR